MNIGEPLFCPKRRDEEHVYSQNTISSDAGDALDVEVPFAPGTLGVWSASRK